MARPRSPRVEIRVRGDKVAVPAWVLSFLPEAPQFLEALLDRPNLATRTAVEYAQRVAHAKREGRHRRPDLAPYNVEATALNAYWRWVSEAYDERVRPVVQAFGVGGRVLNASDLHPLRVGCLAPPWPGKRVLQLQPAAFPHHVRVVPTEAWTLHWPSGPADAYDYRQPLPDPVTSDYSHRVWELSAPELEAVAGAFYAAWGADATPAEMDAELPLFGDPPLEEDASVRRLRTHPRITALVGAGSPLEGYLARARARVSDKSDVAAERIFEAIPQTVVMDLDLVPDEDAVTQLLDAIRSAWERRRQPGGIEHAAQ